MTAPPLERRRIPAVVATRRRRLSAGARIGGCMLIVAGVVGGTSLNARAQTEEAVAFSGTSASVGVNINLRIPGFPATDVPLDTGGPTAQAIADSSGFQSSGYAAFPDPGEFVLTVPGLVPGLVEGGFAGLPPVEFPSLPTYPLFVQSSPSNPRATLGSGVYELLAETKPTSSRAEASAGLRQNVAGDIALVQSAAMVGPEDDGTVVAVASSVVEGVRIGPVSIGSIRSVARQTIDEFGEIQTDSDLAISSFSLGGIGVELTGEGLNLAGLGASVPLPLGATLNELLKASGMTIQFVKAETFEDRVVSPAIRITMPFATPVIPQLGQYNGTATITIGQSTASLSSGSLGAPPDGFSAPAVEPGGSGFSSDLAVPDLGAVDGAFTPDLSSPGSNAPAVSAPGAGAPQPVAAVRSESLLGIESVYLAIVAGALLAAAGGNLIQRLGGRAT